ncbi:PLP-dependent aminotransferase family protein [Aestuariirhabdus sp. Z084]|uniref:aminotransferase-like domain-containing protein n=1 Tax=Aestuariirhabdus haliotis TaxID=2918751 RepID=UPI00201B377C|nr:PLP-dependent aminotransferase family protein [Aestuariirhabdus haliotis]MCL6416405.1 PLP-dependent aminotransferase family protein [Aestuariirhabdus haliotis]MCL6420429.1 PLP-dependent aminotransferase family protein [Aestuariirhabdus haliotis]
MNLYKRVAGELKQHIEQGFYIEGQKLPSIRAMSQERGVSISTVQESYRWLEDIGLIASRHKSGYYVQAQQRAVCQPEASQPAQQPVEVPDWEAALTLTLTSNTDQFVALGSGTPHTEFPTLRPLQRLMGQALKMNIQEVYAPAKGLGWFPLREQIARVMQASGCFVHPDDILITTGCQEALSLSLRALTQPGDIVAIDSPSFYGSMQALRANHLKALEIPTHPQTGISLPALELALEQWPIKVLQLIPTTNNPLGYVMPDSHKAKLLALAEKHDFAIIEDDIIGDLSYQSPRPRTLKSMDTQGRVLMCSSFSKTVAPGLRIGWVAPGRYSKRLNHYKFITSMCSTSLPQIAMAEFIAQGFYNKHLHQAKHYYQVNKQQALRQVEEYFPEGTKMTDPQGGYWLWIELPGSIKAKALNDKLAAFNIGIAPGELFSASRKYQNCLRINFAEAKDARFMDAVKTVGEQAKHLLMQR